MKEDTRFWPLLVELASCLCREIRESDLPDTCFCGVLPGEVVALDYCQECDGGVCGMAWVRATTIAEAASEVDLGPCTQPLNMTVEVGVTRCAPMGDGDGTPPTMAEQLESARLMMADQAAALRAIRCCSQRDFTMGSWTPIGPGGGCVGGYWTVTFGEF